MGDVIEYGDVVQENRGSMNPGRLRLQPESVIFKNIKSGRVDTLAAGDITKAAWLLRARGHCLKLTTEGENIHRFDGLQEKEYERLAAFLQQHYSVALEKTDLSYRGWNWGKADFVANALDFVINDKLAFDVPLSNVSNSAVGKNEVTLQFHSNDDAPVSLVEMRFHLPPPGAGAAEDAEDPCEAFSERCLAKADIVKMEGDAIATFQEMTCLTPRGRYDIKIYPSCLQLHGKTFDYKIPFTGILRLFLLPHRDGRQMFFVISLDPPIKQGQTRYPFLILLFNKEDETVLELQLGDEELQEKYEGKLQREMSGLEYEVVSRIMKTFVNKKITVPGTFLGNSKTQSVSCSYKAASGFLYPLERGFIFMHKPPIHIRFDEVSFVNFARGSGITRSFDFDVETKTGVTYTFVGIEKDEYGKLYDFVSEKKLRVKNVDKAGAAASANYDEALGSSDEGDDDKHDAYMAKMKQEGRDREDDESMSSDDCDYQLPDYGSEVAEEWDTDYASSGSSDDELKSESGDDSDTKAEKKKKREEKQVKRAEKAEKKKKRDENREKREKQEKKEPGEKRKRQTKKAKKDPNAPKRPQSAYMLFVAENREKIKEENPGASITDIAKIAGEKWKSVSADEKKKLNDLYEKDKERYAAEMANYTPAAPGGGGDSDSDGDGAAAGEKKAKKAAKAVKKSPSKAAAPSSAGSGGNFKSKEFIEEDSSSGEDAGGKKPKASGSEAASSPAASSGGDSD